MRHLLELSVIDVNHYPESLGFATLYVGSGNALIRGHGHQI